MNLYVSHDTRRHKIANFKRVFFLLSQYSDSERVFQILNEYQH